MAWATSLTQTSIGGDELRGTRDCLTAKLLTTQRNIERLQHWTRNHRPPFYTMSHIIELATHNNRFSEIDTSAAATSSSHSIDRLFFTSTFLELSTQSALLRGWAASTNITAGIA